MLSHCAVRLFAFAKGDQRDACCHERLLTRGRGQGDDDGQAWFDMLGGDDVAVWKEDGSFACDLLDVHAAFRTTIEAIQVLPGNPKLQSLSRTTVAAIQERPTNT